MRLLIALLLVPAAVAAACKDQVPSCDGAKHVVIVRHAEAEPDGDRDLTAAGEARSVELAETLEAMFGPNSITKIFTTEAYRTRMTGRETWQRFGRPNANYYDIPEYDVDKTVAALKKLNMRSGDVVLVIGHANTVKGILTGIGGSDEPGWFEVNGDICHSDYDNLFVVTLCGEQVKSTHCTYGAETSCN